MFLIVYEDIIKPVSEILDPGRIPYLPFVSTSAHVLY
jgi:hypothetical protein